MIVTVQNNALLYVLVSAVYKHDWKEFEIFIRYQLKIDIFIATLVLPSCSITGLHILQTVMVFGEQIEPYSCILMFFRICV